MFFCGEIYPSNPYPGWFQVSADRAERTGGSPEIGVTWFQLVAGGLAWWFGIRLGIPLTIPFIRGFQESKPPGPKSTIN